MSATSSSAPPFKPDEPFTRADARAAGLSVKVLLSDRFQRICHDLYVSADVKITAEIRARAALRVSPEGSHVSHHSAVELWGAVAPATSSTHVSVPSANGRCVRRGIKAHMAPARATTTVFRGVPLATPEQAFLELASDGSELVDLVIAGDGLVGAKRTTTQLLMQAAESGHGPGVRLARRAARLVRSGVDSPMETRLRLLLVFAGLPEPAVNVILRAADGDWQLRFDLCYEDLKLAVEYDGRQHAESDSQWSRDIQRREQLDLMSWRLVVVNYRGIYREPQKTLERVRDALASCGATGLPRTFNSEWRRHF